MKPGQFSLQKMLLLVALLTVLTGSLVAIEKHRQAKLREINESAAEANHAMLVDVYRKNRRLIEENRDRLSPADYQKFIEQADADWKQRDPGPVPAFP